MKIKIMLLLAVLIQACGKKQEGNGIGEMDSDFKIGEWQYKGLKNEAISINWKIYEDDSISASIPSNWNPQKVKNVLFYVPNSSQNNNLYYAIIKHNRNALKIEIKDYILETFNQISKKAQEIKYIIRKVKLENNNYYLIEIFTVENKSKYRTTLLIYEKGGSLFDIGYKYLDNEKSNYRNYLLFNEMLTTVKFQNKRLIETDKNITEDSGVISIDEVE